MKKLVIGILAHVDAGKTTLSEAMLYVSGNIRKMGRVDDRNAFLDHYDMERERGITIFSKQAVIRTDTLEVILLDTPGHVDFSAEMERTLQVLDLAVLVVSGTDGVQGHTRTLWRLLERYQIPVFLFINKMDRDGIDRDALWRELQGSLSDGCTDFSLGECDALYENAALCEEGLLERYLETGDIPREDLVRLIQERKLFPCYFGSALYLDGVEELLKGLSDHTANPAYSTEFGARVFKILRDAQGNRLTYLKMTGGKLCVRDVVRYQPRDSHGEECAQKVNQIRIYSGEKYTTADVAEAGGIYAVTGLTKTYPGQGLGCEEDSAEPVLEPVLTYQILLPPDVPPVPLFQKLRALEEEEPQLHLVWDEESQEMQAQVMGDVQMEVLQGMIQERFGTAVSFGAGRIVYRETIADTVEGVGHYEPLRHYAEVHLILEPGEPGSGMQFLTSCSEDQLARNWQRLILSHLEEREHRGVLTGSFLTDMKITVAGGRAHLKHTEGGDFRQATFRALRQGLMQAESVLLEPYYSFSLEIPADVVGRAMTDLDQMGAKAAPPQIDGGEALLTGTAPVSAIRDYQREVTVYTRGKGKLSCTWDGYGPCHNAQEVIQERDYHPELDLSDPAGSIFCSHGAGFYVEWDKVWEYMHVESVLDDAEDAPRQEEGAGGQGHAFRRTAPGQEKEEPWIGVDEVDEILDRTFHANRREKFTPHKGISRANRREARPAQTREYRRPDQVTAPREKYLLVDGYNNIFVWKELRELAEKNIDGARGRLLDILCEYQGMKQCNLIVVFDAYRVKGHPTEIFDYHNIHVVYTKEAETADQFIEKFAHENGRRYDVTVATSDGLEQIIIRGQGCALLSARELEQEAAQLRRQVREQLDGGTGKGDTLLDALSDRSRATWGMGGQRGHGK